MRRTSVLFLCSALAPSGACLIGCFSTTSGGGSGSDAGFNIGDDSGPPTLDSGLDVSTFEAGADGSPGGVISDTPVDFGPAGCGSTPGNMTYSIKNTGPVSVTFSAAISNGPFTIVSISPVSPLAPGATATITLGANAIPATATAGAAITGTLTVTTDVPGFTNVVVPLTVTPTGGTLTLTPATVNFGQQQINTTSSALPFTLTNVGNASVTVGFGAASDPEFAITGGGAIGMGTALTPASATFTPTSNGPKTGNAAINVSSGALCGTSVTSVPLGGTGTTAAVNIGPSPLNFTTSCGPGPGTPQTVTIQNTGATAITYTAQLTLGDAASPFSLSSESGSIAANSSATIAVTPKPIPTPGSITPDAYVDSLVITTTAVGASPFTIPLNETASGAILAVTMANTNFGTVQNQTAVLPFTVTNTGNVDAIVAVSTTGAGFNAVLTQSNVVKAGGGTAPGNVDFTPSVNGSDPGTFVVTTTTPVCSVALQPLALAAVGAVPIVSLGTNPVVGSFCGVNCAAPPPGIPLPVAPDAEGLGCFGTLTLTNTGNAPASLSIAGSTLGAYTLVAPVPTSVPQGGTATITVQATVPASPQGSNIPLQDPLVITTNEPFNPVHDATVFNTVTGANLVGPGTITASNCETGSQGFVGNTGNFTASVMGGPLPYGTPASESCEYYFQSDPFSSSSPSISVPPGGNPTAFQVIAEFQNSCGSSSCTGMGADGPYTLVPTSPIGVCSAVDMTFSIDYDNTGSECAFASGC